ncbi:MAG TPA: VWA domain-containing protein [Streptosporangiaceae bacterium]|nr:VWA domain-containing protein [Streptosporangiaceae bacterium]
MPSGGPGAVLESGPGLGRTPIVGLLVGFARELRTAGLAVGSGEVMAYCAAMTALDPTDLLDLYWAGRTTLVARHEQIGVYDEVFRAFFLGAASPARELLQIRARAGADIEAVLQVPATDPEAGGREEEAVLGLMASDVETLRHKSFAACTPQELAALRRIMARIRLTPPRRRTRRTVAGSSGRVPDLRRTIRASLRAYGEPAELYWRQRKVRLRPLILILDISGSMADYSRHLLQFAHTARRAAARVEVFCFGTRLTRITGELATRSPDEALAEAARSVCDWEGGTRIGASLDAFVRDHGRRGLARGGIVVICSDGLDRGDPALLATAMGRLSRLCHTLVWMNPHKGNNPDFRPSTLGMMVAAEHIDLVLSGHDLSSLEELATLLPKLG